MKTGPVDAFFPSCRRCGREDEEGVEMAWLVVMPPKPEPGVYCMPCAVELGLLEEVRGLSGD